MTADTRQREILHRARQVGRVDVIALSEELRVAPETIRRDLRHLADRGVVHRVHGGALPVESAGFETDVAHRTSTSVGVKRRIAAAAAAMLHGAETVYVDEGVTPMFVAEALRPEVPLTIVTSSLIAAQALADQPLVTVLLLGGRVRGRTMATVDHWATRMLTGFVLDLAFVGANGISREHGLTTPDPAVADVKAQVVRVARRLVFAGVHTKFGASSFCRFAEVADLETIITDTALPATEAHRYSLLGPHVIRV
jgi:DeoR family fructose operon transcriptional repressor